MRLEYLPFALPDVGEQELDEVREAVTSGWMTKGPKTHEFELAFAEAIGNSFALAVNACTAALHLALEAANVRDGDEVITTPYTFAATAEVVRYLGATPIFVDVEPESVNIDPGLVDGAVTDRTKAIVPVHLAGLAADMDLILDVARNHRLAVVEDAAHAFPAMYKGRPIGSIGDATCFSFYATKPITTGEGGMICTDNEEWAERCRIMSLHGISRDAWKRYSSEGSWYYEIVAPGYKYNMTDIAAAIGLVQLKKAERMWARRRDIATRYSEVFQNEPALQIPYDRPDCQHAWHLYMLRLNLERLEIDRAQFIEEMKARNIGTSVHFIPLHIHPYYRETYGYEPEDFPVAYHEYLREVSLPIYSRMTDDDVADVIEAVLDVVSTFSKRKQVALG